MSRDEFVVSDERLLPVFDDAGHVDEGTVHAWLDGAFDEAAAAVVEAHVRSCASCAEVMAEARGLVAASSRVLAALDGPSAASPAVSAGVTAARTATAMRPQWWWKAAAGLFVVIGGTVVLRETNGPVANTVGEQAAQAGGTGAGGTGAGGTGAGGTGAGGTGAGGTGAGTTGMAERANASRATTKTAAPVVQYPVTPAPVAPAPVAAAPVASAPAAPPPIASAPATPAPVAAAAASLAEAPVVAARVAADVSPASTMRLTVKGKVVADGSMQPIAYANISMLPVTRNAPSVTSDANGNFVLSALEVQRGARMQLTVRRIGYNIASQAIVAVDTLVTTTVVMAPTVTQLSAVAVASAPLPPEGLVGRAAGAPVVTRIANATRERVSRQVGDVAGGREMDADKRTNTRRSLDREQYDRIEDNPFLGVRNNPLSTFSIDVDRASYGNVRRFLSNGQRPPKDAVRIEEFINYFPYALPAPRGKDPVAITSEVIAAPWQPKHQLVRIALQAKRIETAELPPNNLVFLIDVSGSMNEWNKLPLVKQSLRMLVDNLRPQDRVAIVAYAGAAGLVLPSTSGDEKARIMEAIDRLEAGGSTAGGAGIELAYRTAREHFLPRGNNRVILATDGDFNVGVSSDGELERLVEDRRRDGTYLTVLGVGTGNYQASKMEKLAKVGNGNFSYVDTPAEARKTLVEEMGATLLTVANDVKLQVEFNPALVQAYRLIGYENRLLADEDFNDDTKDAGDIGAGHQVTALYEVVPVGVQGTVRARGIDSLRYVTPDARLDASKGDGDELLFVKLRYKRPGESNSRLLSHAVKARTPERGSDDIRFIAAVAQFGMLLRDSEYKGNSSAAQVLEAARAALGNDKGGYRAEFVQLVERWRALGVTAGERR